MMEYKGYNRAGRWMTYWAHWGSQSTTTRSFEMNRAARPKSSCPAW